MLATLLGARVTLLVDVRAVASSRKPGFSKRQLAASLDAVGIVYVNLVALGTPKSGRDAVRAGRPEVMREIFASHMRGDQPQAALAEVAALASRGGACLLCFERDHRSCHRAIVAEMVAARTKLDIDHLETMI